MKLGFIVDKLQALENNGEGKIAYVYALFGHFTMILMWAMFKTLMNDHFDFNQILYIRGVLLILFNSYVLKILKHDMYPVNQSAQKTLYARFWIQMVSPLLQFYGISKLQISDATVLSLTSPIWIQLSSWLIYGESLQKRYIIFTCISFTGIILVCRPAFLFGRVFMTADTEEGAETTRLIGCACMLLGAITLALSQSLFKGLQGKTSCFVAMQYFYVSNLLSTPVLLIYNESNDKRIFQSAYYIACILLIAIIAYIAQICLSRAFFLESPAKLSQLAYTRIIYSFAIDILFFHATFNILSVLGVILIIYSSINIVAHK